MLDQQHELDALWDAINSLDVYEPDGMAADDLSRLCAEVDRAGAYLSQLAGRIARDASDAGDRDDAAS